MMFLLVWPIRFDQAASQQDVMTRRKQDVIFCGFHPDRLIYGIAIKCTVGNGLCQTISVSAAIRKICNNVYHGSARIWFCLFWHVAGQHLWFPSFTLTNFEEFNCFLSLKLSWILSSAPYFKEIYSVAGLFNMRPVNSDRSGTEGSDKIRFS